MLAVVYLVYNAGLNDTADAPKFAETDWSQIVTLYDQLLASLRPTVIALNRAIAIGER